MTERSKDNQQQGPATNPSMKEEIEGLVTCKVDDLGNKKTANVFCRSPLKNNGTILQISPRNLLLSVNTIPGPCYPVIIKTLNVEIRRHNFIVFHNGHHVRLSNVT